MSDHLADPRLTKIYRLEVTLGEVLDLGDTPYGRRRIAPLVEGTFAGPDIRGQLVAGSSADWQIVTRDGTTLGDIRYTLRTDNGHLLYVQSRGVRHGNPEVLARLGEARKSTPSNTPSAPQPRSRLRRPSSTG